MEKPRAAGGLKFSRLCVTTGQQNDAASDALGAKTGTLRPWTHRVPENYFLKRKKHSHTRWVGRGSEHCSKHSSEPGSEPLRLHDCGDSSESGEDRVARGRVAPTPPLENHREKTKRFRS